MTESNTTRGDSNFPIIIGNIDGNSSQRRNVYDTNGISPTLMAFMGMGGGITPFIVEKYNGQSDIDRKCL